MVDAAMYNAGLARERGNQLATAQRQIDHLTGQVRGLEKMVDKADLEAAIAQSWAEAFKAQREALIAELERVDPGNKLLQASNERWRSGKHAGKPKSWMRRILEKAFDAAAAERRISNPAQIRGN